MEIISTQLKNVISKAIYNKVEHNSGKILKYIWG